MSRAALAIAFALAISTALLAAETRTFHRMTVAKLAKSAPGANVPTRVEVTGVVTLARMEGDGDRHLRICEPGDLAVCVIAECIPDLPKVLADCKRVKLHQAITVRGISRYDGGHRWHEVNPVLAISG